MNPEGDFGPYLCRSGLYSIPLNSELYPQTRMDEDKNEKTMEKLRAQNEGLKLNSGRYKGPLL